MKFKTTYEKYTGVNRSSVSKSIMEHVGELVDSPSKWFGGSFKSSNNSVAFGNWSSVNDPDQPLILKTM